MIHSEKTESEIQRIGREIFAHASAEAPSVFRHEWWEQRVLEFAMGDERLRTRMFRFVDALPSLATGREVAGHLQEYLLEEGGGALPRPLRAALRLSSPGSVAGRIAAVAARRNVRQMARRFIAGENAQEAIETVEKLRRQKMAFTLDVLGEATTSHAQADEYAQTYLNLLDDMSRAAAQWKAVAQIDETSEGPLPRVNLSIKLSSLAARFDGLARDRTMSEVGSRLRPILTRARELGAYIHVDMEQYDHKDLTLHLFGKIFGDKAYRDWADVGIVTQAYLRDSERDLRKLIEFAKQRGAPITVRLVKGAYWDYETIEAIARGWPIPVYTRKWRTDSNYENLSALLLDNAPHVRPALGSHNVRSLAAGIAMARERGLDPRDYEFQMLYGMGDALKAALVEMGLRVRIYTPYGPLLPGMSYLIRRLLENTSNDSFLRQSFTEHDSLEHLLANPYTARPPSQPLPRFVSVDPGQGRNQEPARGQRSQGSDNQEPARGQRSQGSDNQEPARGQRSQGSDNEEPAGGQRSQGSENEEPAGGQRSQGTYDQEAETMETFQNTPLMDFAVEQNRRTMEQTIGELRAERLGASYPLIVGGKKLMRDRMIDSIDPSNKTTVIGKVSRATAEDADHAVAVAKEAWPAWNAKAPSERAALLRDVAEQMRERRYELAAWEVLECAKPFREADADVAEAIDFCEFYAMEMVRLHSPARLRHRPGEDNTLVYEGRGVAAIIAPWNFPLAILTGMTMAALVAGNTVVVKPAEQSAVIAAILFEMIEAAGFPPGVANFLPGEGEEVGARLVEHVDVATIAFTGSRAVGLKIHETTARTPPGQPFVKRAIVEMGGKNAIVIDADADLDDSVRAVVQSAFGYAGQKCSACSRVVVVSSIHRLFMKRLVETVQSLVVGRASDSATDVPPVIDEDALNRIRGFVERARRDGEGEVVCELKADAKEGFFFGPVVFDNVKPRAPIAQEEIFGPVLAVMEAKDFDDALRIANDVSYALTGGVHSRSPANIERAKREFHVGNLYINRNITGALVDKHPFGGFKLSGAGSKAGGPDYLKLFCNAKAIAENTLRQGFAPASAAGDGMGREGK